MDRTFDFHGTTMTIKSLTSETGGIYTILYAVHPPNVGPALHLHPRGSECFYIVKGRYNFVLGNRMMDAISGDLIVVPKNIPHKFTVGIEGGEVLIISPPDLENYFSQVSELLQKGLVTWELESEIAQKYGQVFLENTNHWK
ncbi:MAG: cupin domain-containing protein [Thaumarchaeota archaeon]|nr:cupin domain-containing protein [Nitrososphaerota archaeon]MDE1817325.1 cupin domain-containing protein [Nitrososphaerota archaeon]MDE1875438.1 cupin domain-containing protein [Nitrososphaerota archaeon]